MYRIDADLKRKYVPFIGSHVYLAAGCRIIGGVTIGDYSIIGVNTVIVNKNIPPLSIVAGNPGKVISTISEHNCLRYKGMFKFAKKMSNEDFILFIKSRTDG